MALSAADVRLQKTLDIAMQRIERPYARAVAKEKNRFIRETAAEYTGGLELNMQALNQHIANMTEIAERYNNKAISVFARSFRQTVKTAREYYATKDDEFDIYLEQLYAYWLTNETAKNARETANTTQQDIARAVAAGISADETTPGIIKRILRTRGLSPYRAETIARTETHNAALYANKESARNLQRETGVVLMKKWLPAQDERTRESHRAMADHEAIPLDNQFLVGGERLDRPGDPDGSARNVINCRCVLKYVER